jgi:acetolactate synthase-1/2/3 large subunit
MLRAYEVPCVFGVPGDTNILFYSALEGLEGAPRHVLTRDERSAGFMADAYARLTRRPGVVEVPSGAGPMYALPAIAEANESAVPLILLTFDMPMSGEGRGIISQFIDLAQLLAPVTKLSVQIKAAAKIPETIRRAFRVATTGRPGAVHLVIPEDILHQEIGASETVSLYAEEACKMSPAYAPCAPMADLLALQNLVCNASRPLLVAGGGVSMSGGGGALTTFAERYRIPVVTTMTGRNAIPDLHELSLGIIGDNGFLPQANRAMEEADLLIYIGSRIGSTVSIGWTFPAPRSDRKIVQIDICPEFLANNTVNALSICRDARSVLEQLNGLPVPTSRCTDPKWIPTLETWSQRFWQHSTEQLPGKVRRCSPGSHDARWHMREPHFCSPSGTFTSISTVSDCAIPDRSCSVTSLTVCVPSACSATAPSACRSASSSPSRGWRCRRYCSISTTLHSAGSRRCSSPAE